MLSPFLRRLPDLGKLINKAHKKSAFAVGIKYDIKETCVWGNHFSLVRMPQVDERMGIP